MMREGVPEGTDLEYVSRVLRGDTDAFRPIVDIYKSSILRLCSSYLKNKEEAEDAAQEIFFRAFKSLRSFNLDKRFATWLYSIAINHLKTRYSKILKFNEKKEKIQKEPVPQSETPESIHEREEERLEIRKAIDALPGKLKEVTILYYIEGMNIDDICEVLALGRENVKSRLFRARKQLRDSLEKLQPNEDNEGIHN